MTVPQADEHPCAKPVELYAAFIQWHTQPGDLVLDPFMGEAPCGVAAVRLGRRFAGVELDGGFYEKAKSRIQEELRLRDGRGPVFDGNLPLGDME